ncbi:MAG: cation diffusion facilitator family transporter [Rhodospirillales bacterium]|nr:cation diffusion facilitator family transporter [Rhodospirillales bacterium]
MAAQNPAPRPAPAATAGRADAAGRSEDNDRLKRWATTAAVAVAALLIAGKTGAYLATGAVSLLSSLIDSLLDLLASLVNFVAIRQAAVPADREHRFGHGKAEPLAGLAQAAFVAGSSVLLLFEAGSRLLRPTPIGSSAIGIAVMVVSIFLTLGLVLYQRYVVRKTDSVAIGADALHYRSDLMMNLSVIAALVLSANFGITLADPVFGIAIALYILVSAWSIFSSSLSLLMDHELDEDDRAKIKAIASAHPAVISLHDLRTRSSGTQTFIQFHLELNGGLTLLEAHAIADEVMEDVERAFPSAEVLIHEDPEGIEERRVVFH